MNIHFGFSYIGLIFLLMLMLPNIIWSKNKPNGVAWRNASNLSVIDI